MDKPEHCNFELRTDGKKWNLKENQSPRGLRHEDKRPDVIVIDCYKVAAREQLHKHIENLVTLRNAMR